MVITGMNNDLIDRVNKQIVKRKTKSLVRILTSGNARELENEYERFCEILWSEGGIIKGCQFANDTPSEKYDTFFHIAIYYEIETERVERFKKEVDSL